MADPVITLLGAGESTLANTPVAFAAQPAGTILMLCVVGDAYKAGDPAGWVPPIAEVQANHGLDVWLETSTGAEVGVTYGLTVAARSVWAIFGITEIDLADITDGVDSNLSNVGGDDVVGDAVLTSAGRKIAIQIVGASHSGGFFTDINAWLNAYTEAGQSFNPATAPGLAVGVAALVLDGGGNTNSGATFVGPTAQSRTSITLVLNANAIVDAPAEFELPLGFTAEATALQDATGSFELPLGFEAVALIEDEVQESSPTFELPLGFEAVALIEDADIQDANGFIDLPLSFSAVALVEGAEDIQDAQAIIDLPLQFSAFAVIESDDIQDVSPEFELPLAFTASAVKVALPPVTGVCGWDIPEPDCCDRWELATVAQRERAVTLASDFLWGASGRRFGACEVTVRPCGLSCPCEATGGCVGGSNALNTARFGFTPVLNDGVWSNCKSCSTCRCCAPCEVALPGHVGSIVSVRVNGLTVPPTAYRVDNFKYLVRDDGACWPECQDFGKRAGVGASEDTFEVTYLEGVPVPYAGLAAASELACYLLKTCPDGTNCGSCLTDGAEQSPIVATWLATVNPNKLTRPAKVFVPGAPGTTFRTETWRAP